MCRAAALVHVAVRAPAGVRRRLGDRRDAHPERPGAAARRPVPRLSRALPADAAAPGDLPGVQIVWDRVP